MSLALCRHMLIGSSKSLSTDRSLPSRIFADHTVALIAQRLLRQAGAAIPLKRPPDCAPVPVRNQALAILHPTADKQKLADPDDARPTDMQAFEQHVERNLPRHAIEQRQQRRRTE